MGKWRGGGGCVQLRKAGLPPRCKHLAISHRRLPLAWVDAGTGTLPQAFPAIPKDNEPEFSNRDMLGKGPGRMRRGKNTDIPCAPCRSRTRGTTTATSGNFSRKGRPWTSSPRRRWTWPWSHMNIMPREEPWDTAATRMFAQSATAPMCLEPGHKGNTPRRASPPMNPIWTPPHCAFNDSEKFITQDVQGNCLFPPSLQNIMQLLTSADRGQKKRRGSKRAPFPLRVRFPFQPKNLPLAC